MTRKDYIKIASVLKAHQPSNYKSTGKQVIVGMEWNSLVYDMASMLNEDNDRFDWNRFTDACGVNG